MLSIGSATGANRVKDNCNASESAITIILLPKDNENVDSQAM